MPDSLSQTIEEILVIDCQRGSRAAFEELVRRSQKRLWQHARWLTGDTEGAWEVMQESWLGIVRGIRRLDDPAKFRAWALRIVTNRARSWVRDRAKRRSQALPKTAAPADMERYQDADDVRRVLEQLSERSQEALRLFYLQQLTVGEVALVLRLPTGTVKSRLHAARQEFKKAWLSTSRATPSHSPGIARN